MVTVYTDLMWFTFIYLGFSSSYFAFFKSIQTDWLLFYLDQSSNNICEIQGWLCHFLVILMDWRSAPHCCPALWEVAPATELCVVFASMKRRVPGRKRECWSTLSGNWKSNKGKKRLQLTSVLSTHPFVQKEAVWPKFILPHLPRRLFSLLGKHLEKCMKLKKEEYMWIYYILTGEE